MILMNSKYFDKDKLFQNRLAQSINVLVHGFQTFLGLPRLQLELIKEIPCGDSTDWSACWPLYCPAFKVPPSLDHINLGRNLFNLIILPPVFFNNICNPYHRWFRLLAITFCFCDNDILLNLDLIQIFACKIFVGQISYKFIKLFFPILSFVLTNGNEFFCLNLNTSYFII